MGIKITQTDMDAVLRNHSGFILNKGAKYYMEKDYESAIEYYHLAASMGEEKAASNLGYCYLYGRYVEQNVSLAIAYFQIAASKNDIDALYKLGNIYSNDKFTEKDTERSLYYYKLAIEAIEMDYKNDPCNYPSLYFSVAKEMMPGGKMNTNISLAYRYLKIAEDGYEMATNDGCDFYESAYAEVKNLLGLDIFNGMESECDDEDDDDFFNS